MSLKTAEMRKNERQEKVCTCTRLAEQFDHVS